MILLYDRQSARYRDYESGRFVSRQAIHNEIDRAADFTSRKLVALTERLRNGEISVDEWQSDFKDHLRAGHTLAGSIAGGGKNQMSGADWLAVARETKAQYRYLNQFAFDVANGLPLNLGRVKMYAKAIRHTFQNMERRRFVEAQYAWAIWIVTPGENCAGCLQAAGKYSIESTPKLGSHECLTNCRCLIEYE